MAGQVVKIEEVNPLKMAWFDLSDLGNAERFVAHSKGMLRHGQGKGWIAYDTQRWSFTEGLRRATLLAHLVAKGLGDELAALRSVTDADIPTKLWPTCTRKMIDDRIEMLAKHSIMSGNHNKTQAMMAQAAILLDISLDQFDTDPFAFNLRNCTLRFRMEKREERPENAPAGWRAREKWVVERRTHDATDMITRMADIDYDPDAACPEWMKRLDTIQPEEDQRILFQQIHGYSLLGVRDEQKFVLSQGRGGDGKSLTYAVIAEMMGSYYAHADVQTFLAGARKSGSDHSSDLARLSGDIRLVTCDEPEKFSTFNTKIIKQVTGGGKITARALREAETEFVPQWLLIMECNPMPRVPTSDDGFWRRALLFQWPIQFKGLGMRPEPFTVLKSRLLDERSGILNWMIEGALKWLSNRELPTTRRSEEVKDEYRRSSDPFGEWYLDRVMTNDPSVRTLAKHLYDDFKHFCEEQGMEKVPTPTAFGNNLAERQHKRKKSGGIIWREGIRLKDATQRDSDDDGSASAGPSAAPSGGYDDDPFE